jgi:diazepam-binding inhibitor (GABA receptor modulating acyl-CoA-binding protein)
MSTDYKELKIQNLFKKYSKRIEINNEYINNNVSNDDLLILYACFKQATIGDCNVFAPNFYEFRKKSKYDAWNSIRGTLEVDAMTNYIIKAKEILG